MMIIAALYTLAFALVSVVIVAWMDHYAKG